MAVLLFLSMIGTVCVLFILGNLVLGGTERVMFLWGNQCPKSLGETRLRLLEQEKEISKAKSNVDKNAAASKVFADSVAQLRSSHQMQLSFMQGISRTIYVRTIAVQNIIRILGRKERTAT